MSMVFLLLHYSILLIFSCLIESLACVYGFRLLATDRSK